MHNGFWDDYETYLKDDPDGETWDINFDFLDSGIKSHNRTPYHFLHGECNVFAVFLHDKYGYDIESLWNKGEFDTGLIHSYCTKEINGVKYYIDIRGITDSYQEFMKEFYDNGLWSGDFEESYITYNTLDKDTYQNITEWDEAYKASEVMDDEYLYFYDINKL